MLVLHQAPVAYRGLSLSPFCIKVEAYLRLVGLPYRTADADPRRAPKGKVPWLVDGARTIADSSDIVDYLKAQYGDTLDVGLAPRERAAAVLLRRTVEEHLYWALLHARWVLPEGYAATRALLLPHLPKLVGGVVLDRAIRRSLQRQFEMQGLGRHGDEDVARRGAEDLGALAGWLGDRLFFLGDEPRSVDASVFAMLLATLHTAGDAPLTTALRRHGNLRAYVERMYERCFGPLHGRPAPGQGGA